MKNTIIAGMLLCSSAFGVVSIQFSDGLSNNTYGLSDGTTSNGLLWGILASTDNFSASDCQYDQFSTTLSTGSWLQLSDNDFMWLADSSVASNNFNAYTEDFGGGFDGVVIGMSGIDVLTGPISAGDSYGLIWFDAGVDNTKGGFSAGENYHVFLSGGNDTVINGAADSDNIIQADGSSVTLAFDDIRTNAGARELRTLQFAGEVVPEPTSGVLLGLAGLALAARRKR